MIKAFASGQADLLTGRHINWSDPLEKLLCHQDEIVKDDLYTLRRRTLA